MKNIPTQSTMIELLGQPLFEVWQELCSVIDEKYDMERLWNTGGKNWTYEYKYKEFIGTNDISFGGNNFELYFEEDDFDKFADKLKECDIEYVHPIMEHSWGQRVVRFYDPDKHIIEVGENMKVVCKRFLGSGMTPEQVAERMNVPMKFINACMR